MMKLPVYLDCNATTPVAPEVADAIAAIRAVPVDAGHGAAYPD